MNKITLQPVEGQENVFKITIDPGLGRAGFMSITLKRVLDIEVKYEGRFYAFTRPDNQPGQYGNIPLSVFKVLNDGNLRLATKHEMKQLQRQTKGMQVLPV